MIGLRLKPVKQLSASEARTEIAALSAEIAVHDDHYHGRSDSNHTTRAKIRTCTYSVYIYIYIYTHIIS